MMEHLPVDILTRVLEYALLPERLNLATCNTSLLTCITKECSALWVDIHFHPFLNYWYEPLQKKLSNLTDDMLSALLKRVNAESTTKSLTVWGCVRLLGRGLEPLRHSQVLESVDFRFGYHDENMNESFIVDLLRTMLPYKLCQVRFQQWSDIGEADSFRGNGTLASRRESFYRDLRAANSQRLRECDIACLRCHEPVYNESRQTIPNVSGVSQSDCSKCHHHFCRSSCCPVNMMDCKRCGGASCGPC